MTPVAKTVGSPRIVPAAGIVHPLGNAQATPEAEQKLRRDIIRRALQALQADVTESTVFPAQS